MGIVDRYRAGRLDLGLSAWQLLAFAGVVGLLLASILVYRHFTDDSLRPTLDYLLSLKLALPPIIALVATYLYAFVTGEPVSNAPRSMWAHLRNRTLQDRSQLRLFIGVCVLLYAGTTALLLLHTPPAYRQLVAQLLGGANDDHQLIADSIARVKSGNVVLADRLTMIRKVFEERRLWNHENKAPTPALPRIFIRALDAAEDDAAWVTHPLRRFALAEAHSMLAQALSLRQGSGDSPLVKASRQLAIGHYQAVIDSRSNLVTALMKKSASQNIGNVHFYSANYAAAIQAYGTLSREYLSAGTEGNKVAAYVASGDAAQASQVGQASLLQLQDARHIFTELRDYVGLLTNTGFAKLITGDSAGALAEMQAAYDLMPDAMGRQNLALALNAANEPAAALALLAEDSEAPLVTLPSQLDVITKHGGGNCSYLIRAIAHARAGDAAAVIAANVAAYARQAQPIDALLRLAGDWKAVASKALQRDQRPCGSLILLPSVKQQLQH